MNKINIYVVITSFGYVIILYIYIKIFLNYATNKKEEKATRATHGLPSAIELNQETDTLRKYLIQLSLLNEVEQKIPPVSLRETKMFHASFVSSALRITVIVTVADVRER